MPIKYKYAMFYCSMKSSMANVEGHVAMINTMIEIDQFALIHCCWSATITPLKGPCEWH